MGEPGLQALRVLRGHPYAPAARAPHHERYRRPATHHKAKLGRLVDKGVHGKGNEVVDLDLDDRPRSCHRRAHRSTRETRLGDRCVPHALRAEPLQQTLRGPEDATHAHVLAHEHYALVPLHLLGDRLGNGGSKPEFSLDGFRLRIALRVRRVDRRCEVSRAGSLAILGELDRCVHLLARSLPDLVQTLGSDLVFFQ